MEVVQPAMLPTIAARADSKLLRLEAVYQEGALSRHDIEAARERQRGYENRRPGS